MHTIKTIKSCLPFPYRVIGKADATFNSVDSLFDAKPHSLTWIKSNLTDYESIINKCLSSVIICDETLKISDSNLKEKTFIVTAKPDVVFLRVVNYLYAKQKVTESFIHPTALIHQNAKIGTQVHIGAYVSIGECEIGDNTIIETFAKIHDRVKIGKNVLISEYCNIGGQGFGHILNEHNELENISHIGNVIIEDNVEIFPYSNVDRATLSSTIIKKNTKIDHYCHIGHNTFIGENTVITAKVVLCGGSKVGNSSWLGVGTIIREKVIVGNNVTLGMGSVVTKNVPDNEIWLGSPAKPIEEVKLQSKKIANLLL